MVTARPDGSPWIRVVTPYSRAFIDALKEWIPVKAWDPETKSWWVHPRYSDELRDLLWEYFGVSGRKQSPRPPQSEPPRQPTPYEVLGVSPGMSTAEIRSAYLKLIKANHPDINPNGHLCTVQINQAFEEITKQRGAA